MRLPAIFNTTAARLTALFLLLFTACAIVLIFYMTSLSVRMLTNQTRETINEEVLHLSRTYQRGGLPFLVRVVERRARQPGANLYLIADTTGRILSGNVESLAPGVLDGPGWTRRPFTYVRYGEHELLRPSQTDEEVRPTHTAVAQVFDLPNGMIMLVGRDLGEPERLRFVVRRALTLALGMMGIGGLLIWYFVGRRALKRIDAVSAASRRIMGGDLTGRLPVTGTGDEFDRLSENLNTMLARISELNEGLREVSANIAHDLKTPLTRLRNRAEAALGGVRADELSRDALESIIVESDQLIRTFNAILMISRLEAGGTMEEKEPVDLDEVVKDVCELYEPLAEEAGVSLQCGDVQKVRVNANRELVGQALSNIVDNAIKYCAETNDRPEVFMEVRRLKGGVQISVCDNGPGVPEHERERATERFVRLEKSRTRPGSGLGLSLAKAIAKFHGGTLELTDNDPGLCVTMIFPPAGGGGS